MTASLVQSKTAYDTTSGLTIAATFDSSVVSGNTIIAAVTWEDDGTVTIADDVNSGNYTKHVEEVDRTVTRTVIASIPNTASSAITVTATFSDAKYGHIVIMEVSGIDDTTIDATAVDNGATGDCSLALTTASSNCFVVAARTHWPGNSGTDTGFTSLANAVGGSTDYYHSVEYDEDIGSAGLNTLTFDGVTGEYFSAAAASFALASSGTTIDAPTGRGILRGVGRGIG